MSKVPNITQERLKQLFHYDCATGDFTRLKGIGGCKSGTVAGNVTEKGYIRIKIDNKAHRAHRLAWLYVYGSMPEEIDHINLIKNDNRICNLRVANGQNAHNRSIQKNNTSGFKGVIFCKKKKLWRASIRVNWKRINLGRYKCPAAASFAYQIAADIHHGEFARPF